MRFTREHDPASYVSPIAEAKRLYAQKGRSAWTLVSRNDRAVAQRLAKLPLAVVTALEREEAPIRGFIWVAWGATRQDQERRGRLLIHLYRHVPTSRRGGWPDLRALAAAWKCWRALAQHLREHRQPEPAPDKITAEEYVRVMAAAPKSTRKRRSKPAPVSDVVIIPRDEYVRLRELERLLGAASTMLPQPPPAPQP